MFVLLPAKYDVCWFKLAVIEINCKCIILFTNEDALVKYNVVTEGCIVTVKVETIKLGKLDN